MKNISTESFFFAPNLWALFSCVSDDSKKKKYRKNVEINVSYIFLENFFGEFFATNFWRKIGPRNLKRKSLFHEKNSKKIGKKN